MSTEHRQPIPEGYFLYHSIGMYPGKETDLAAAMTEFAQIWGASNDKQWGYVLRKRQDFIDYWRHIINAPRLSSMSASILAKLTSGLISAMEPMVDGSSGRPSAG